MIVVGDTLQIFSFCPIADVRIDVPAVALMLPDASRHCGTFVFADEVVAITMLDAYGYNLLFAYSFWGLTAICHLSELPSAKTITGYCYLGRSVGWQMVVSFWAWNLVYTFTLPKCYPSNLLCNNSTPKYIPLNAEEYIPQQKNIPLNAREYVSQSKDIPMNAGEYISESKNIPLNTREYISKSKSISLNAREYISNSNR